MKTLSAWIIARIAQTMLSSRGQGDKGHLEVERKFKLLEVEIGLIEQKLVKMGFSDDGCVSMVDIFLPVQKKGDMIRIRRQSKDGSTNILLTVKEWQIVGQSKERKEREAEVGQTASNFLLTLGRGLAGGKLPVLSKERQLFSAERDGRQVVISIDKAEGLGQFSGYYMEIEMLLKSDQDIAQVREQIFRLAQELTGDQREPVQISYRSMLDISSSPASN